MDTVSLHRSVHEVVSQLLSVVKSARLYSEDHVSVKQMIERFSQMLGKFLESHPDLEIEVHNEGLKWEGHPISRSGGRQEDLAFRLYRDGIRLVTFVEGVELDEIESLVRVFLIDTSFIDYQDHDLATLLWQQRFPHIRFAIIESFSQFVQVQEVSEEGYLQKDVDGVKTYLQREVPLQVPEGASPPEETAVDLSTMDPEQVLRELPDMEKIRSEALPHLMNILLKNLTSENESLMTRALTNLNILLHLVLHSANLKAINRMLRVLLSTAGDAAEAFDERLNSTEMVKHIAETLEKQRDWNTQDLAGFLSKLRPEAVKEMTLVLLGWEDEMNGEQAREALTSFFKFHGELLDALILLVNEIQWERLLKCVEGEDNKRQFVYKSLTNPYPNVRILALRDLPDLPADRLSSLLWDESERVRTATLSYIGQHHREDLLEDLKTGIIHSEFEKKSGREREKWFIIAAMTGKEEMTEFFTRFFERRSLLDLAAGDDLPILAARALGVIGTPDAEYPLLAEAKRITNPKALRQACQTALDQIRRKTGKIDDPN